MTTSRTAASKADFNAVYAGPDPRAYFRTLGPLDYQVPRWAAPVIRAAAEVPGRGPRAATVLDVCCSYGVNAALLGRKVEFGDLVDHYTDPGIDTLDPDQVAEIDTGYFAGHPATGLTVYGLDSSRPAVDYATRVGLLAGGWAADLESQAAPPPADPGLLDVGTVVCTGGVGYITEQTFDRLLRRLHNPDQLWLVVFVLRVFGYESITKVLDGHGLVTERLPGTFPQRRFADGPERDAAIRDVRARGLDPTGRESDGWFHAECYVSRPADSPAFIPPPPPCP